ncbi:chaperone protein dnaJ 49 [Carex littledalei]|uniref:Chaperone protein dnaJ 49 n=1 Tax=Carex littledalei TaxID=544730 RepID=A0A833RRM9_9POAL|nr:chaperone protein dnaJ 49 [Carex littledalei]
MAGNKDEALRCIKIAESSLESGDKQRALKFVKIAKRLDPTISVDYILSAIENPDTSKPIPQRENHHFSKGTHQPETSINYTEEQVRLVHEIRKNKDYYAILGVEKTSSAEEIKRAYKKLSLKIHPDKNRAPGAEEAFKSVLEAFNCLSNDQSRRNDDQTEQSRRNDDQTEQSRRNDDQTEQSRRNDDQTEQSRRNDDHTEQSSYDQTEQSSRNDDQTEHSSRNEDQTKQSRRNDDQTGSENYSYTLQYVKWVAVVSLVVVVVVSWVGWRRKLKIKSKRGHKNKIWSEFLEEFL